MYDSFSCNYDRFVNWQSRLAYEMPFLEEQIKTIGKPPHQTHILDSACGTGMHAIALAQLGYHVSGADISEAMVRKARDNAATAASSVELKTAGFGELFNQFRKENNRPGFDAILCLGNSLPHLLSHDALLNALEDFSMCLQPGGFLFIQNRNFDEVLNSKQRWMEPQAYSDGSEEWLFIRFYDFEANGQIRFNIQTLHRKDKARWEQNIESTMLLPLLARTYTDALKTVGFKQVQCFGDMTGSPFEAKTSGNLILRASL